MDPTRGFVVPAGGGKHLDMAAPGRFAALKLVGHETNESIMLFEETVPVGTKSLLHLHRDSDEVAWVLAGEITFKIGDEVTVEELLNHRPINDDERNLLRDRYHWEVVGPNPLWRGCAGPVLTDDDTRRLAAQHRDQARRDGVDILRAYDARPGHQLEDAGPRAHREAHRAPGASTRGAHDADVSGVESRAGQGRRDHDVDTLGEAQPDLPRGSLE